MILGTDSGEYEILRRAAEAVRDLDGLSIELGLREGGGSQHMVEPLMDTSLKSRVHIAIDPYGSLPYEWKEGEVAPWVYDNTMRNNALINLYKMTHKTKVNFLFFCMLDNQFFDRFKDGVPVFYAAEEKLLNEYVLVHFDAVHSFSVVQEEVEFFLPRTIPGSIFVFDDINGFYDHESIEKLLFAQGWSIKEKGLKKASYVKV